MGHLHPRRTSRDLSHFPSHEPRAFRGFIPQRWPRRGSGLGFPPQLRRAKNDPSDESDCVIAERPRDPPETWLGEAQRRRDETGGSVISHRLDVGIQPRTCSAEWMRRHLKLTADHPPPRQLSRRSFAHPDRAERGGCRSEAPSKRPHRNEPSLRLQDHRDDQPCLVQGPIEAFDVDELRENRFAFVCVSPYSPQIRAVPSEGRRKEMRR
jgi:hypothetical protein